MSKAAQKINATTQGFIEIQDIVDDIVVLAGGQACIVLEVTATNFTLQSEDEQQVRILAYASFLNSLSFAVQIVILSRQLDISSYIKLLELEAGRTQNQMLSKHIVLYKDFIANLVKNNLVLDKKFYLVIPYSFLEKGAGAVANLTSKEAFVRDAKAQLRSKASSVIQELIRVGLKSKILNKEELTQVYYEIYNSESGSHAGEDISTTVVRSIR